MVKCTEGLLLVLKEERQRWSKRDCRLFASFEVIDYRESIRYGVDDYQIFDDADGYGGVGR